MRCAGAAIAEDEIPLARVGPEDLYVGGGEARGLQPRRDRLGRPRHVAGGRVGRVDLDEFFVDLPCARVVRSRLRGDDRGGEENEENGVLHWQILLVSSAWMSARPGGLSATRLAPALSRSLPRRGQPATALMECIRSGTLPARIILPNGIVATCCWRSYEDQRYSTLIGGRFAARHVGHSARASAGGGTRRRRQAGGGGQDVQVKANQLAPNFYALQANGLSTVGVLTGPDGVLMVDAGTAALTEKIVAAIKQVSDRPIRFLINTHVHADHTGGNENFGKMGVTILARDALRTRLMKPNPGADGAPGNPAPAAALALITYDGPVTFHMNGEDVQLIPVRSAHTDGDTMVKFPVSDVIMSGDFFRSLGYPNIDLTNGGSLKGVIDGLDQLINAAGPCHQDRSRPRRDRQQGRRHRAPRPDHGASRQSRADGQAGNDPRTGDCGKADR